MTGEFERIRQLRSIFGPAPDGVVVGIGDDAAVIAPIAAEQLVWTIDACVENVHFRRDIASWEDVGFRSFMAAASDLAAMAARPVGALASLTLPRDLSEEALFSLARGQRIAAQQLGTAVIGGNLACSEIVTVSTTLLGRSSRPPGRDGARPGHVVALFGEVGLAAAGLRCLLRNPAWQPETQAQQAAAQAWRRPRALIEDGLRCQNATSLIDVSDGLVQDAKHLAEASGVRLELSSEIVLSPSLRELALDLGVDPRHLALAGGEDYALLGTFEPDAVPAGFVVIGTCREGEGVWVDGRAGNDLGHDHFR
jgi:thiamine-monophosphate kinase